MEEVHWEDSEEEMQHDGFAMEEVVSNIIDQVQDEVRDWMRVYGRKCIREWMDDNAKTILKSDGAISRKESLKRQNASLNLLESSPNGGGNGKITQKTGKSAKEVITVL